MLAHNRPISFVVLRNYVKDFAARHDGHLLTPSRASTASVEREGVRLLTVVEEIGLYHLHLLDTVRPESSGGLSLG